MRLIIDGYNLLKTMLGPQESSEHRKHHLIAILASYARRKGHTLIVVFDGGFTQHVSQERHSACVSVVHVGYKKSADDYIKKLLREARGHECVLVSSDNELIEAAYDHDMVAIDASVFAHIIEKNAETPDMRKRDARLHKLNEHATHEIDELMKEESKNIPFKQEQVAPHRMRSRTQSKYEKRIMKVLKKL